MHTHENTHSNMLAHTAHTFSSRLPRRWWTTVLPLCCTLLHLELWASCIFNRGNLHRHCVCQCILCQWDCLSPYLHSPLTLQLLFWGHKPQTLVQKITKWYCFYHAQWSERKNTASSIVQVPPFTVILGFHSIVKRNCKKKKKILSLSPSATNVSVAASEL